MDDLHRAVARSDVAQLEDAAELRRRRRSRCRSRRTEIHVDHDRINLDLIGRSTGDDLAVVEDVNVLTGSHHQADIVLDQADGEVPLVDKLAQELPEEFRLPLGLPEAGSSRSSTFGCVIRARATSTTRARPVGNSLTSRSATSPSPTSSMVRSVSAATSIRPPPAPGVADLSGHLNVVPHRERGEELQSLVGPRQPTACPPRRSRLCHVVTVDRHPSGLGCQETADDVEQCGLAGTVRPDQAGHPFFGDRQRDVAQDLGTAEGHADLRDLKDGHRPPLPPVVLRWQLLRAARSGLGPS